MTPLEMISGDREDYEDDENDAQSYIGSEKVTLISYEVFRGFFLVNSMKKKKKKKKSGYTMDYLFDGTGNSRVGKMFSRSESSLVELSLEASVDKLTITDRRAYIIASSGRSKWLSCLRRSLAKMIEREINGRCCSRFILTMTCSPI